MEAILPSMKEYKVYLKHKYNIDNLYEEIKDADGEDITYNLKNPISNML